MYFYIVIFVTKNELMKPLLQGAKKHPLVTLVTR